MFSILIKPTESDSSDLAWAPVPSRITCRSFPPFRRRDAAAVDDRPHGSEWKNTATVVGNYDLLAGDGVPPLLVAPGGVDSQKTMMPKNSDHLL